MKTFIFTFLGTSLLLAGDLFGITDPTNRSMWEKRSKNGPDKVVPGWLINLGPTGARAILTKKTFIVKYIFKGSPAEGKLKIDDVITGVNGNVFSEHTFSYNKNHGIEGPMYDMGMAIEESEGSSGILTLSVTREGVSENIEIELEKLGSFSPTFPENCQKTKLLYKKALDWISTNSQGRGIDGNCAATLALLTSSDKNHFAVAKKCINRLNNVKNGAWSWDLSLRSIALAEYHLLTQDSSVLPNLKKNLDLLREYQFKNDNYTNGGFWHHRFNPSGGNGYGTMQYPTMLASVAWGLGKECGFEVKHPGLTDALTYTYWGTNTKGSLRYASGSPQRKKTTNDGHPQRAGLGILAFTFSPDFEHSDTLINLYKENIKRNYKGMANGHADLILGFTWGMLGACASGDEELKRKVFDYYKVYLNMSRNFDNSSYTALPGRDYAERSYYRDDRSHMTSAAALIYSFYNPRLQVQGVKVTIPGVSHKTLRGNLAKAYNLILDNNYGAAAKLVIEHGVSEGSAAEKILNYLNTKAKLILGRSEKALKKGNWLEVKQAFGRLYSYWNGVPHFDERSNYFKSLIIDEGGAALLEADGNFHQGKYGETAKLLASSIAKTSLEEVRKISSDYQQRVKTMADNYVMKLKYMEVRGEWYTLFQELKKTPEVYGGIAEVDRIYNKLLKPFSLPSGKALAKTHKTILDGNYNDAAKMINKIKQAYEVKRHALIAAEQFKTIIKIVTAKKLELEEIKKKGSWNTLYRELLKCTRTHSGVAGFSDFYEKNMRILKSNSGRTLISSEKLLSKGSFSMVSKSLETILQDKNLDPEVRNAAMKMMAKVEDNVKPALEELNKLAKEKDWAGVKRRLYELNRDFGGIGIFEREKLRLNELFLKPEIRVLVDAGNELYKIEQKWKKRKSRGLRRILEEFSSENSENIYGKRAKELLKK